MKKLLLSAIAVVAASFTAQAIEKTVTFDFNNPAAYGYEAPTKENTNGTPLNVGDVVSDNGVTITDLANGETPVRFYANASTGLITLRWGANCSLSLDAGGSTITAVSITGNNTQCDKNFTTSEGGTWTWDANTKVSSWVGVTDKMVFTRLASTVQFSTMTVTYDAVGGGTEPGEGEVEKYIAIETQVTDIKDSIDAENPDRHIYSSVATNVINPDFANAVCEDGMSEVKFGTANMDVIALGGTTPKDVEETEAGVFPGWNEWNDVKWDNKNQNLDDKKTRYFSYLVGTGNPVVGLDAEAIMTDGVATGKWRATYIYYGPQDAEINGKQYRNQLPLQGLYYKFMPKAAGQLKITVWSNKGNRNTFVVDGETAQPVAFTAEGYINGQNEALEDGTTQKKYLSAEEIQALHDNAKCEKDSLGEIIPGTDSAPYVIGAGNQNFWGYLTLTVEAGKAYWLFQDSSQIGFAGYEFTPAGGSESAIQTVSRDLRRGEETYDLFGRRQDGIANGRFLIRGGQKIIIR